MRMKEAMALAAQAWCEPETSDRVMDPPLAKAFAKLLVKVSNGHRLCGEEELERLGLVGDY